MLTPLTYRVSDPSNDYPTPHKYCCCFPPRAITYCWSLWIPEIPTRDTSFLPLDGGSLVVGRKYHKIHSQHSCHTNTPRHQHILEELARANPSVSIVLHCIAFACFIFHSQNHQDRTVMSTPIVVQGTPVSMPQQATPAGPPMNPPTRRRPSRRGRP